MKRYEYTRIAALLTIVFSMCCCPTEAVRALRRGPSKIRRRVPEYFCSPPSSASYFVRSSCESGGVLTVHRGRVFLQLQGLERYSRMAAFQKESCTSFSPSTSPFLDSAPVVRYRHRESGRYLCFTRKGRMKTVGAGAVEGKGVKCMFREERLETEDATLLEQGTYHTIQSMDGPGWFVGFNLSPSSTFALRNGREGRGALARVGWRRPGASCGFRFHSEVERKVTKEEDALMHSILQYIEDNEVNTIVSEAANSWDTRLEERDSEKHGSVWRGQLKRRGGSRRYQKGRGRRPSHRRHVRHLNKKLPRPDRRTKNLIRAKKKRKSIIRRQAQTNWTRPCRFFQHSYYIHAV